MTKSKEQIFHEKTGGCWHEVNKLYHCHTCSCGQDLYSDHEIFLHTRDNNPTYSHTDDILKRMKEFLGEERYSDFIDKIGGVARYPIKGSLIPMDYIFNQQAFLDKCLEYLEGK